MNTTKPDNDYALTMKVLSDFIHDIAKNVQGVAPLGHIEVGDINKAKEVFIRIASPHIKDFAENFNTKITMFRGIEIRENKELLANVVEFKNSRGEVIAKWII